MGNNTYTIYFDEAGRGPLAGPLFVGLVCPIKKLSKEELLPFCDSKQISEARREELFEYIEKLKSGGKVISIPAWMTAAEIDKYGMSNALHCAILRGILQIFSQLSPEFKIRNELPNPLTTKVNTNLKYTDILNYFSEINTKGVKIKLIMDGNRDFGLKKMFPFWDIKTIISGDAKVKEIGMASIVAKVSRDRIMERLPKKYANYKFDKHKGYGTKEHKKLLQKYGPCNIHRKLFLKRLFPDHKFSKKLPEKF